jgi:hypothetical protein
MLNGNLSLSFCDRYVFVCAYFLSFATQGAIGPFIISRHTFQSVIPRICHVYIYIYMSFRQSISFMHDAHGTGFVQTRQSFHNVPYAGTYPQAPHEQVEMHRLVNYSWLGRREWLHPTHCKNIGHSYTISKSSIHECTGGSYTISKSSIYETT